MKRSAYAMLGGLVFLLVGCSSAPKEEQALMQLHAPENTGVHFSNQLYESTDLNIITFEYLYNGAGVAVGDINQDGLPDMYFSGNMVDGKLYLNKGNFKFEDITAKAGISTKNKWGTGVSMVDINEDGWLDLYLCFSGPYAAERRRNMLYINNGDLTFTEQAAQYGLDDDAHTTHAAFFDYDRDGDLDAYLLNNMTDETGPNVIRKKRTNGEMLNTDRLYRNDNGHFVNVSREAGILKEGYGLGIAIGDVNQDGWADIYVSNDYLSNDLLYINNQDGTFTDKAAEYFRHTSYSSMGCDMADYNNDSRLDIVAVDMLPPSNKRRKMMMGSVNYDRFRSEMLTGYFPQYMRNSLQWNRGRTPDGKIVFSEIGQLAGIECTDWSWSPLLADLDNDGWKDLVVSNGYPRDITNLDFAAYKANLMMQSQYNEEMLHELIQASSKADGAYLPNYIFRNLGDLTFENVSTAWGFTQPSFSHGAAIADLDNDGDLDYITNNSYDPVFIYENKANQIHRNHFLRLRLNGKSNAFGTKVWLYQDSTMQYQEFYPYRGFQSSIEPIVHFGLGNKEIVDSLVIEWMDGNKQVIPNPLIDQLLIIDYQATKTNRFATQPAPVLFEATGQSLYKHVEPHFSDFNVMPLLLQKYSQVGPSLSMGDVNQDGLEDFFVGGAFQQSGQLFMQRSNGSFLMQQLDEKNADKEDGGSLFFDADQDGDLDLYVTSSSSEFPSNSEYYQDRLYRNDGKGNFELDTNALPAIQSSTACVTSGDYDRDGDLDLFVGGYVELENYPRASKSYVLENKDGIFKESSFQIAAAISPYAIVKDAEWTDINGDGWVDLVIVGEWMPLEIFINQNGQLEKQTQARNLANTIGWWNCLTVSDLDKDGDLDLIAGNVGKNHQFHKKDEPLSLYIQDFDKNGKLDPIFTHFLDKQEVPLAFRNDLLAWMFPLKRRFINYESYATTDWANLFPNPSTEQFKLQQIESSWFENDGNGNFSMHALPEEVQIAPINDILADDFNQDGNIDLLLVGNSTAFNPYIGYMDASNGLLLLGDGKGNFKAIESMESGFYVEGESKSLKQIELANGKKMVFVGRNNEEIKIFHALKLGRDKQ